MFFYNDHIITYIPFQNNNVYGSLLERFLLPSSALIILSFNSQKHRSLTFPIHIYIYIVYPKTYSN
jgi:hypothetical protein